MFTGEMMDGNGLAYLRARYYVPELGMFTGLDPIESFNRYQYVEANPVNLVDPSALRWCLLGEDPDTGRCRGAAEAEEGLGKGLAWVAGGLNNATEGAQGIVGIAGVGWDYFLDSELAQYIRGHEQEALLVVGISLTVAVFVVNPVAGIGVGTNLIGGAISKRYTESASEENISRLLTDALLGGAGGALMGKAPILQRASFIERASYTGLISSLQGIGTDVLDDKVYNDPNAPQELRDYVSSSFINFYLGAMTSLLLDGSLKMVSGQDVRRATTFSRIDPTLQEANVLRETTRRSNTILWRSATLITGTNISKPALEYTVDLIVEREPQYCTPVQ